MITKTETRIEKSKQRVSKRVSLRDKLENSRKYDSKK